VRVVRLMEPAFGGVNLEDIASPKCFYVLERLRAEASIPVWHDDQQGTAGAVLAALLNALKVVGKRLSDVTIALVGAGAANVAVANVLMRAGARAGQMFVVDSKGILHLERPDIEGLKRRNPWKYRLAVATNEEGRRGGIREALRGADVVIAASRPGPGVIRKEWVREMSDDPVVFALANPVPEIWPWEAKEAGARVVATGRSDFPNQVNNSLVFPSVFRGALDVRSRAITDGMIIAAAEELARFAEERGLSEDYVIPRMTEWEVYPRVAAAVAVKACEEGVARKPTTWSEELHRAQEVIGATRKALDALMRQGLIG
ncbi:MAG: malate dehydrogenase, partial [Thermoprotei archaeon]